MRRTTILVVLTLTLVSACVSCRVNAQKPGESDKHFDAGNESFINPDGKPKKSTQAEIDAAKALVERLLPSFAYSKDEFNNMESYMHIIFTKPRTTIMVCIVDEFLMDASIYYANDWIFHDRFYVKIDEKVVTVNSSETSRKALTGNLVVEHAYTPRTMDGIASRFIATNPDKEVRVRLGGSEGRHYDFTLNKNEQEAICETVELYDALMLLNNAGIDIQKAIKAKPAMIVAL